MYSIYVLKSQRSGKRYVGWTGRDPLIRLKEHNGGSNKFTKGQRPLDLVYVETCDSKLAAQRREKFLKSGQGRKFLDSILTLRG